MVLTTEWAQVEAIELTNDGFGLGFGIIGGRSTGVVVKTILPGSVADRDGRLQSGDHILHIGEVNLRGMGSEQVAMVLRQSGSHVRLIVARPVEPTSPTYHTLNSTAPIVPTRLLSDPEEIERHLSMFQQAIQNGYTPQYNGHDFNILNQIPESIDSVQLELRSEQSSHPSFSDKTLHQYQQKLQEVPEEGEELPEMEVIDVRLTKDQLGLGITVAGYICEKEEITGIFVKSISKGSAADMCGKLQLNDQIIEVDGKSLQGYTNHQAVEVLRNTGKIVKLRLARYLRGVKFEQLQQAIFTGEYCVPATTQAQVHEPKLISSCLENISNANQIGEQNANENYSLILDDKMEEEIKNMWKKLLSPDDTIVVAHLSKFKEGGGLGISLEGTVDVEDGKEVRPHHYIGSILTNGPVGRDGKLCPGDELLEVNGKRLLGLNHKQVVQILKELPKSVCLVCARHPHPPTKDFCMSPMFHSTPKKSYKNGHCVNVSKREAIPRRLVKAKSDGYLMMGLSLVSSVHIALSKLKSRSLEPLTSLATWSSEPHIVELMKGDKGLGFSILDYQDPMNPNETVIVIRSLVPGGVAQQDGRLIPGDRLLFVNNINLENASLEMAVHALQGAPKGLVRIGIAKPLPCPESNQDTEIPFNDASNSGELLSENLSKSVYMPLSFESDQKFEDQLREIVDIPVRQTSLTPSSLLSGGFNSSKSTPLSSPAFSPSTKWDIDIPPLPNALERIIRIKKGTSRLGLNLELVEKGINGMLVKSVTPNSAVEKDGNLALGDYILSVNNESMRKITKSQARAILKRAELLSTDIIIKYIPGPDAAIYHQSALMALQHERDSPSSVILPRQLSPRSPLFHSKLPEDITNGELSEESIVRSLPLGNHEDNFNQMLSPCAPTSEGLSTIPTPSSFSTDFSELKRLEDTSQSEDDERKDFIMDEESQNDLSEEQLSEETEDKITEKTTSPSFAEIRAVFSAKSAPCKPFVPLKPKIASSPIQSPELIIGENDKESTKLESFVSSEVPELENSIENEEIYSIPIIRWGPNKLVEVWREMDSGIGISIVKSVKDNQELDSAHSGIFIKSVLENSPAGQTGAIKKGDRILEVDDTDITNMSYERVVDLIRNSRNPIKFLLQSPLEMETTDKNPKLPIIQTENKETDTSMNELFTESLPIIPNPELLVPRRLSDRIEILSTSIEESEEEIEEEDEISERQVQGKIYSKKGYEIDRASAAHIKLSSEDLTDDEDDFGYSMKKIKKKYGDMNGELIVVELQKGPNGLGLSLAGNKDRTKMSVFVCGIHPSGNAAKDGRIKIGDELLEVNGLVMYGRCHLNASAMIKGLSGSIYKIILIRKEDILDEMAVKPIIQFPIYLQEETQEERFAKYGSVKKVSTRKGPQGLGIMIIEGKHAEVGQGIFISDIQDGSPAKQAGLNVGDMILAVNQTELIGADYDTAASVLKQIDGSITIVIANPNKLLISESREENKGTDGTEKIMTKRASKREKRNATSKFGHFPVKSSIINCRSRTSGGTKSHTFSLSSHFSHYTPSRTTSHFPKLSTLPSSSLLDGTSSLPEEPVEPPADPKTCEIKPGQETTIEINKEKTGLGLNIVGGIDTPLNAIVIHEVYPDGAAACDGRLQSGDQILELNGENFRETSHAYAITALQKSPSIVQLTVYREPGFNHEKKYDILQIELYKKSGRGLGLSIVGRKNGPGVFISDVVKGGVAEADGRLMQGDQILEVNNIDLKNSSQEHAAAILKTTIGKVSMKIGRLKASSRHNSPVTPDSVESLGINKVKESNATEALKNISLREFKQESYTRRNYIF